MSTEEGKRPRGTVSLDADVLDRLYEEQFHIRKAEGKRVSYSDIVRRWAAHAAAHPNTKKPTKKA